MQKCSKCGKKKSLNEDNFHRDNSRKTGFAKYCKSCARIMQAVSRRKPVHLERENLIEKPVFDSFDRACMEDKVRRDAVGTSSIDKAI